MKKILIIALVLLANSANAFYTSFDYDIERLREGVMKQQGTLEQKEAFIVKITPTIKQAREQAYTRIAQGCTTDIARLCPSQAGNTDASVKCLSDNQAKLSSSCTYIVKQNFRQK